MIKKDIESKIVKKYLRWIYLLVVLKINVLMVLKGKILPETSTIIKQDVTYVAGPKEESGVIKFKTSKVCKIKSIKSVIFFSFIVEFIFLKMVPSLSLLSCERQFLCKKALIGKKWIIKFLTNLTEL